MSDPRLGDLATIIDILLNGDDSDEAERRFGFVLLVVPITSRETNCQCISNLPRIEMGIDLMREFVKAEDARPEPRVNHRPGRA